MLGDIQGKIAMWGKVIACGDSPEKIIGYRAEYAYPIEIWIDLPMAGFLLPPVVITELKAISQNYGCRVRNFEEW